VPSKYLRRVYFVYYESIKREPKIRGIYAKINAQEKKNAFHGLEG
jgi:hypothetical protein